MPIPNILDEIKVVCNGECENCGGCNNSLEEYMWDRMEAYCLDEEERMFDDKVVQKIMGNLK
jgi:hypothetical protein